MSWHCNPWSTICAAILGLGGCASPTTEVILLPQADGSRSAVVVSAKGGASEWVGTPYQRATTAKSGTNGALKVDRVDPSRVQADNATLFKLLPPGPERIVLYFKEGGTTLTPESHSALEAAIDSALARAGGDITVTGYTDTVGTLEHNDALARRRAREIAHQLIQHGFPRERIEVIGRGERELAILTADGVVEPSNRRVVLEVR